MNLNSRSKRLEIGLDNLGNTCFANSSLQCLLHIDTLTRFFLENDVDTFLNHESSMKGRLATSFAQLVRDVHSATSGSSVSPLQFLREVRAMKKVRFFKLFVFIIHRLASLPHTC